MDFTRFALHVYVSYCLRKTGLASAAFATVQLVVGHVKAKMAKVSSTPD